MMEQTKLTLDVDVTGKQLGDSVFVDTDLTVERIWANTDRILRSLSDRALSQALDSIEEYGEITDAEVRLRMMAGLTVLLVNRIRSERDRRLSSTAATPSHDESALGPH
jgi:hypothetical protein